MVRAFRSSPSAVREIGGTSAKTVSTADASVDHPDYLYEAVVCETHSAALLTAALTSAINAFGDTRAGVGPQGLRAFVPRDTGMLVAYRSLTATTELSLDSLPNVSEFLSSLANGRALLDRYFSDAQSLGSGHAAVLHRTALGNSWRGVCKAAILAIDEIDDVLAPVLPKLSRQSSKVLIGLLADAKDGGRPCIDEHGRIHTPMLPQQRHAVRRTLFQDCGIRYRGLSAKVFVKDVSTGGLGLDRVPQLAPGEIVAVELRGGRRFTGVVAWSSGTEAGIKFATSLSPTDPLLMG
jgi:hypothetical protein